MAELSDIIAGLSPEQQELLRLRLSRLGKGKQEEARAPILPRPRGGEVFPLSLAQQRIWFVEQLVPGSAAYNIPLVVRLTGRLDVAALGRSLNEVVRRHEILRTSFEEVGGQPVQVIAPELELELPLTDLSGLPVEEREERATRLAVEEAKRVFVLSRLPLMRVSVVRLGEQEHLLVLIIHHIISDKWSHEALLRELVTLYEAFSGGRPSPLPPLPIQYADYAHWQRNARPDEQLAAQLEYWRRKLADAPAALRLPTDHPRPEAQTFRGATLQLHLSPELTEQIEALCRREGVTLYMSLLAAFKWLVCAYTGQEDIVVGTPVSGRSRVETENLIGFFANTLVLRSDLSGDPTYLEALRRVRDVILEAHAHQDISFDRLVDELQIERDPSRQSLFQVVFNVQTNWLKDASIPGLAFDSIEVDDGTAKFDLTIFLLRTGDEIKGYFVYSVDLFEAATVERMMEDYEAVLRLVTADPAVRLSRARELTERARQERQAKKLAELKEANMRRLKNFRRRDAVGRP